MGVKPFLAVYHMRGRFARAGQAQKSLALRARLDYDKKARRTQDRGRQHAKEREK